MSEAAFLIEAIETKFKNKVNFKMNSIDFYAGLWDEVAYGSRGVSYMTARFLLVPSSYKQF